MDRCSLKRRENPVKKVVGKSHDVEVDPKCRPIWKLPWTGPESGNTGLPRGPVERVSGGIGMVNLVKSSLRRSECLIIPGMKRQMVYEQRL